MEGLAGWKDGEEGGMEGMDGVVCTDRGDGWDRGDIRITGKAA